MTAKATTSATWDAGRPAGRRPRARGLLGRVVRTVPHGRARSSTRSRPSNPDKITILKLNVDENPDLAMKYQITSIPAMKVFDKGEVETTIIGAKPKFALEQDLAGVPRVARLTSRSRRAPG